VLPLGKEDARQALGVDRVPQAFPLACFSGRATGGSPGINWGILSPTPGTGAFGLGMRKAGTPLVESLLEGLLEQSRDHAMLLFDASERIVWVSPGAIRIFGREAPDLVGRDSSELFVEEDVKLGIPAHEFAIARSRGSSEDDRWTLRPDGSRFWATGVAYSIWDEQGNVTGYAKIIQNRTDWKEQQEALRNQVKDLTNLDQQKNRMIATLAHELRNPLVPLLNAANILREGAAIEYPVKLIERQVDLIKRLVDDLLDSVRIHAGKVTLHNEDLILQEVLAAAVESTSSMIQDRQQTLDLLVPPGDIAVVGDPVRLQQVFSNLLTNATRYTPEGGRIWVKTTVEGDEAVVRVEDNGVGIEPVMLGHIFELFAQVHTPEPSDAGLGIGLALVKELVVLHGGTVQANSDGLGKGSDFIVRLPLGKRQSLGPDAAGREQTDGEAP
jgi:PAS domain S-box-containing protein